MPSVQSVLPILAAAIVAAGCGAAGTEGAPTQPLTGAWKIDFLVLASPRGTQDEGKHFGGNLAFVSTDSADAQRAYGAYALESGAEVIVGRPGDHQVRAARAADSVVVTLGTSASQLELRGLLASDTLTGVWSVEISRSASARGTFVMHRKQ